LKSTIATAALLVLCAARAHRACPIPHRRRRGAARHDGRASRPRTSRSPRQRGDPAARLRIRSRRRPRTGRQVDLPARSISNSSPPQSSLRSPTRGKCSSTRRRRYLPEWFATSPRARHAPAHPDLGARGLPLARGLSQALRRSRDADRVLRRARSAAPRRYAPGTRWSYSNTNYKALALMQSVSRAGPFDSVLSDLVLRPRATMASGPARPPRTSSCRHIQRGQAGPARCEPAAYVGDGACAAMPRHWRSGSPTFRDAESQGPRLERSCNRRASPTARTCPTLRRSTREFLGHA